MGCTSKWNLGARQFWYAGKSVTLYDPATPFYASEAAPAEIDDMLEQLVPKLDFAPPLADFLYRDPYKIVRGNKRRQFWLQRAHEGPIIAGTLRF